MVHRVFENRRDLAIEMVLGSVCIVALVWLLFLIEIFLSPKSIIYRKVFKLICNIRYINGVERKMNELITVIISVGLSIMSYLVLSRWTIKKLEQELPIRIRNWFQRDQAGQSSVDARKLRKGEQIITKALMQDYPEVEMLTEAVNYLSERLTPQDQEFFETNPEVILRLFTKYKPVIDGLLKKYIPMKEERKTGYNPLVP